MGTTNATPGYRDNRTGALWLETMPVPQGADIATAEKVMLLISGKDGSLYVEPTDSPETKE